MTAVCINCGESLEAGGSFCPECGVKQESACPECGATVESGASFCGECGSAVSVAAATKKTNEAPEPGNTTIAHVVADCAETLNTENEAEAAAWDDEATDPSAFNPYFLKAIDLVKEMADASVFNIQRQLRIAPQRAEQYVAKMESYGVVSALRDDGTRIVFYDVAPRVNTEEEDFETVNQNGQDTYYVSVVEWVIRTQRASIAGVQRQFRIGYNRAACIIENMEREGIVTPMRPDGSRQILVKARGVSVPKVSSSPGPVVPESSGFGGLLGRLFGK